LVAGGDAQKLLCLRKRKKALAAAYVGAFLSPPFSPKKLPGSRSCRSWAAAAAADYGGSAAAGAAAADLIRECVFRFRSSLESAT